MNEGEIVEGHANVAVCLNCGATLVGPHCHRCGQVAHVHRTLGAFFHDLLHGVFHFEGKIWRTLPLLIRDPGRLTREYIDGRRASYVSPMALFLFSVFLMFAVVKQFAVGFDPKITAEINGRTLVGIESVRTSMGELEARRAELVRQGKPTVAIDDEIESHRIAIRKIEQAKRDGFDESELSSDVPWIERTLKSVRANPAFALYRLKTSAYKFSWALIPISVPLVCLLFARGRSFPLYDHVVFVTYSLCFMTLLVVALAIAGAAGIPFLGLVAMLVPPWHMYRQLRGTYALGAGAASWRTAALLLVALAVLLAFALLLFAEIGR